MLFPYKNKINGCRVREEETYTLTCIYSNIETSKRGKKVRIYIDIETINIINNILEEEEY